MTEALCWTCRRADGDKEINPDGYCSWIAQGKLPKGCKGQNCVIRESGRAKAVIKVVACPLYERYGKLPLPDPKVKNCAYCGRRIKVRRANQIYCNKSCSNMAAAKRKREQRQPKS